MILQIRWDMPVPSHVLRDASEVRYYTALEWQHVNTMFSRQISWKKLSRKVLYTARCARIEFDNAVRRNRGYQQANGQNRNAGCRECDRGGAPGGAAPLSSESSEAAA